MKKVTIHFYRGDTTQVPRALLFLVEKKRMDGLVFPFIEAEDDLYWMPTVTKVINKYHTLKGKVQKLKTSAVQHTTDLKDLSQDSIEDAFYTIKNKTPHILKGLFYTVSVGAAIATIVLAIIEVMK